MHNPLGAFIQKVSLQKEFSIYYPYFINYIRLI